jgi:hypothetical protein
MLINNVSNSKQKYTRKKSRYGFAAAFLGGGPILLSGHQFQIHGKIIVDNLIGSSTNQT